MAQSMQGVLNALEAAEAAAAAAAEFVPSASKVRRLIDEAEERAQEHGDSVKQSAQAQGRTIHNTY